MKPSDRRSLKRREQRSCRRERLSRRAAGLASLFLPILCAALAAATPAGKDLERSIESGGRTRGYHLHVPPGYDGRTAAALVLVFHGGGGSAEGTDRMTHFAQLSDRKGFLLVYPEGTGIFAHRLLTWNSGNCCGYAMDHKIDDSGFVRALVAALSKDWTIDRHRIFATGLSNGAMMSYRVACELSDVFAAVAPVAGAVNIAACSPGQPVSVIAFHGTADRNVLYQGGQPLQQVDRHPRVDASVADSISFWTRTDGCPPAPARVEKGSIVRETYAPCRSDTAVELVTIRGGGHAWPGGEKWPFGPEPTHEISATETMWEFFQSHPKK